ncbi:DUF2637 domain-containing protein [Streptomyces sp. AK02-01A]|uniref:DUF2637 domain-containing protein n=1 Tax=Streptomyces sp. AK02-01A TaxID=3028648 RepID=UPI0029B6B4DF|nr:DUF2637 domain-containing protein [Streptomyces sp. AK02-01A]MDX3855043.1 DUF2637 domain-containing protein [Streptomyces sp. AK02-01A]
MSTRNGAHVMSSSEMELRGVPPLTRPELGLMGSVALAAAGVGALGLASSFSAVSEAAARWEFSSPWMLPIGIDIAIPVFTGANLLLIRTDMALGWVRFVPWVLTLVTCYLNVAAGTSASAKAAHGTMPLLWVVFSEITAHVYAVRIGAATGKRMEKIRKSRWLLAPLSTFALWRRMTLWEITAYAVALDRERERQLARADLRERHGRRWRSKTPHRERVLLKLGELTPDSPAPITPVVNQEETPFSATNQSGSDLPVSTPTPTEPDTGSSAAVEVDSAPALPGPVESIPVESAPVDRVRRGSVRRPTGPVPSAARSSRPRRTMDQLLLEARELTADWSDSALTGEAIRKALRTAPDKARKLRDTLRAERGEADGTEVDAA